MKHMHLLAILITLLTLSSCSTYQYVTLEDASTSNGKSSASIKDSVEVSYSFLGEGGTVVLEIRNNSENPIIVDKIKSSLIKGDQTIPFWEDKSQINTSSTTRQSIIDEEDYNTDTKGQITKNAEMLFIPPASKGELAGPKIQTTFIESTSDAKVMKISIPSGEGTFKGEQIRYQKDSSPHQYRVFLTFSRYGSDSSPVFLDKSFNATTITNTSVNPDHFYENGDKQFYIKKATGFGTFMGVGSALGAIIILTVSQK